MKTILTLLLPALLLSDTAVAQPIEAFRGGWMADVNGQRHIYYIVLRNDTVSGVFCFDCENIYNLSFIDDGVLDENSLQFSLYHYPQDGAPYREGVTATLHDGDLNLRITTASGATREQVFHRTPREDKIVFPIAEYATNRPSGNGPRQLPGTPVEVTARDVVGTWLWGTGPTKQYFFFREHRGGIRGMVCGPCYSVNDMAPLEQISMSGTNFHFEIVHEDNGAYERWGPHSNIADAMVSRNEMHMTAHPSYDPDGRAIEMNLLGPVQQ